MRIVFGTDDKTALTECLLARLLELGHDVSIVAEGRPWAEVGESVGLAVASGAADRGVVCCFTGTGVSIAANKVPGVRAALCGDAATAAGARRWNDANVLAISLRLASPAVVEEMIEAFLTTGVDESERAQIERLL